MKRTKIFTLLIILFTIITVCCICIYFCIIEKSAIIYVGENENWHCEYKADLHKDKDSDFYKTYLTVRYKENIIHANNIKVRLTRQGAEISSIEINNPSADPTIRNPIRSEDGTSGMPAYYSPLNLYINLDGKEENITLYEK
jgi:hypothetical protein